MELFSLMAKLTLDSDDFMDKIDSAEDALNDIEDPDELTLGLDNSEFNDNIDESTGKGEAFESSMSTAFGNVAKALTAAGIVGTLAGIVNWLKQAIDMTAETADGIDKGSKRLGISTQAYQEWDHALKQSGASISDLNKGIRNMQKLEAAASAPYDAMEHSEDIVDGLAEETVNLGDDAAKAFKRLGISARVASGELSGTEEIMKATLLELASYRGDDRSLLVRALFGNNADGLNALLDEGKDGVEALLSEASDLGLVMDQEEIDNAVAYGDAVANLQAELQAIQSAFVKDIIPVLTDAVTAVTNFLASLNPRNRENGLQDTLDKIDAKALDAGKSLDDTGIKAINLIQKLAEMGDYWTLDDNGKKTWNALAQEFIDTYPQFSEYIDFENKEIIGNTEEIEKNIDAWVRRQKQIVLDNAILEKKQAIAEKYAKALDKETQATVKEGEIETKRAGAVEEMNKRLEDNWQFKNVFSSSFGADSVNENNILDAIQWMSENAYDMSGMENTKAISNLQEDIKSLRDEAKGLNEDADKAQEELEAYNEALSAKLKLTQTETDTTKKKIEELTSALLKIPQSIPISFPIFGGNFKKHAIGSDYIPYDNYPALLHRGEKVLTATEARQSGNVDFSGLEDRIEAAIRAGMSDAKVNAYIDGRAVTDEVNRNNINAVKGRRFAR